MRAAFHSRGRTRSSASPASLRGIVRARNRPVLPRNDDECILVEESEGAWVRWNEVSTFGDSGPNDRHYTLDGITGTVTFGPTIASRTVRNAPMGHSAKGSNHPHRTLSPWRRAFRQRWGEHLTVLKSSIPYVASDEHRARDGGLDAESLEAAKFRTPQALRSQDRAVTVQDYEFLARESSRRVARARCIQARGGLGSSTVPPGDCRACSLCQPCRSIRSARCSRSSRTRSCWTT